MTHPKPPSFARTILGPLSLVLAMAATGCERDEIRAYRAPKFTPTAPMGRPTAPPSASAEGTPGASSENAVTWTLPSTWREVPTTQQMRLATFDASGVEVTVAAFPGDVGGTLANVNRWRGQIGLAPATEADLPGLLTTSREGAVEVSIVSMTGSSGQVLLAASIVPGDGKTWFVKAVGDPSKIEAIRESFAAFSKSFRIAAASAPAAPNTPATAAASPTASPHGSTNPIAQRLSTTPPPPNWKPDANASSFLAASFTATNGKGTPRATASSLLNDGGGLLANINRWRDQLGLASLAAVGDQPTRTLSPNAILVDLANAAGTDRQAIIVLTDTDKSTSQVTTWFFKLRGTPDAVAAELSNFETWAKAVGGIQ